MPQINGINHVMLICHDMDVAIRFYVGVLGFRVKATTATTMAETPLSGEGHRNTSKLYFLEVSPSTMIVLGQVTDNDATPSSPAIDYYWPRPSNPFTGAAQLDHLAFNVDTVEELEFFRQRLIEGGVDVSEIQSRNGHPKFVKSIYFYDPDRTPLEIATWDYSSAEWDDHRDDDYYLDQDPVPSIPDYARPAER
jgi:catechol 2,3-dioxygenase-like lactoylglutathione lyase family enzyme